MTTTAAAADELHADAILAYVPHRTPEGDGILITADEDQRWTIEGDPTEYHTREEAVERALALAAERWA